MWRPPRNRYYDLFTPLKSAKLTFLYLAMSFNGRKSPFSVISLLTQQSKIAFFFYPTRCSTVKDIVGSFDFTPTELSKRAFTQDYAGQKFALEKIREKKDSRKLFCSCYQLDLKKKSNIGQLLVEKEEDIIE